MKWIHTPLDRDRLLLDHSSLHPGWALPAAAAAILSTAAFWVLLAAIAAVASIGALYARTRRAPNQGVSTEEENRLWRELSESRGGTTTSQTQQIVKGPTTNREDPETTPASNVAEDARNVADLFRTLRRDQAKGPAPAEVEVFDEEQHTRLSVEPTLLPTSITPGPAAPLRTAAAANPAVTPSPSSPGRMTMNRRPYEDPTQWPSFPAPTRSATLHGWPGHLAQDEAPGPVPGAWPAALEELPFQVRMDITDRLESDLEWAEPGKAQKEGWAPGFIARTRNAVESRRYERLRRQVELTKGLMRSGEPELRKQGVELAVRLEDDLHAIRSRRVKRAYRK